nr:serine hydrolase [Kineosphaera limosa]
MEATATDAFLVVHAGSLAVQWYRDGSVPTRPQALMSITKSIVGCLAGSLIGARQLDPDRLAADYVPELLDGGYAPASVRDLLDMRTGGPGYREDYDDPDGELAHLARAVDGTPGAATLRDLIRFNPRVAEHDGPFCYRSLDTDALGWVLERASGVAIADLIAFFLARLGVTGPVDMAIDSAGVPQCSGGLAMTPLDVARFGLMVLHGGAVGSRQVVPTSFFKDTRSGGPDSPEAFRSRVDQLLDEQIDTDVEGLRTGHYRNQFWVPRTGGRALMCLGIHGQWILVDPDTDAVVVKLSSWPDPQDPAKFSDAVEAGRVATAHLADNQPQAAPWLI